MKNEFVPYNIALAMKNLGFNQTCYAYYSTHHNVPTFHPYFPSGLDNESKWNDDVTIAPLFSQAFRFFREKYNILSRIDRMRPSNRHFFEWRESDNKLQTGERFFDTYEEAELACLTKLIEIVEQY